MQPNDSNNQNPNNNQPLQNTNTVPNPANQSQNTMPTQQFVPKNINNQPINQNLNNPPSSAGQPTINTPPQAMPSQPINTIPVQPINNQGISSVQNVNAVPNNVNQAPQPNVTAQMPTQTEQSIPLSSQFANTINQQVVPNSSQQKDSQSINDNKNIIIAKNSGRSALALGILLLVLSVISFFGVGENQILSYYSISLIYLLSSIGLVYFGRKLQKSSETLLIKNNLNKIAVLSLIIFINAVVNSVIQQKFIGLFGLVALVTFIYMLIARTRVKNS